MYVCMYVCMHLYLQIPNVRWEDVGGLEDAKRDIREMVGRAGGAVTTTYFKFSQLRARESVLNTYHYNHTKARNPITTPLRVCSRWPGGAAPAATGAVRVRQGTIGNSLVRRSIQQTICLQSIDGHMRCGKGKGWI